MMIVFVDRQIAPDDKDKALFTGTLSEGGFTCDFVPQIVEGTISWCADTGVSPEARNDIESESLVVLGAENAVRMVKAYHEKSGSLPEDLTLTEWVQSMQAAMPGKNLSIFVIGMNKYYSNQKLTKQRAYREKVTGKPATKGRKKADSSRDSITVTCEEAEEVFVDIQLLTGCIIQHVDDLVSMSQEVLRFTKAVMDKHKKKNRLDSGFSFTDTNGPALNVKKTGEGLIKVWKKQLTQFNNIGADVAEALVSSFQSPSELIEACSTCHTPSDVERTIGDINVRRGTSIIASNRRIGKEHARRIHTFMTSSDPDQVIK